MLQSLNSTKVMICYLVLFHICQSFTFFHRSYRQHHIEIYSKLFTSSYIYHNNRKSDSTPSVLLLAVANEISTNANNDVNALPDSKRLVLELSEKVTSFLSQDSMNVDRLKASVRDMELESSQPSFWDDSKRAQTLLSEMNRVKQLVDRACKWKTSIEDVNTLLELSQESSSDDMISLIEEAQSVLKSLGW